MGTRQLAHRSCPDGITCAMWGGSVRGDRTGPWSDDSDVLGFFALTPGRDVELDSLPVGE